MSTPATLYLVLRHVSGTWLADSGSSRRAVDTGETLLAAIEATTTADRPTAETGLVLELEAIHEAWIVRWRPTGQTVDRELVVRANQLGDADRLWAAIAEPPVSLGSIGDRFEALAFAGSSSDVLRFEIGGEAIEIERSSLRMLTRGRGLLAQIGRIVSIHPNTLARKKKAGA